MFFMTRSSDLNVKLVAKMKYKRGYYDMFVRACAMWPGHIAVRYHNEGQYQTYTYSELYGVCEYISQNLQQLQSNIDGIIGLVSKRNVIIPCIIAAAHKSNTAFMFLEPSKDINSVLNTMQFKILIMIGDEKRNFEETYRKADKTLTIFNINIYFFVIDNPKSNHSFYLTEHSFIAMSSGSTGDPKHIQVPIQCIQPNINDLSKLFNITKHDIIYFSTPLTFDPSMIEILLACENGASLLIAPENADILFPEDKANAVTFWQTTPSKFFQFPYSVISNRILCSNSSLKVLAFGGEPLNGVKRLRELKTKDNKTKMFTLYGVTEMSCWACLAELDLDKHVNDNDIPLGNCLSETDIQIQPSQGDKNVGNIVLLSKTRKCVVLNKPEQLERKESMNYVDTGDLGEIKNGFIYYRGRRDDIIKRFGHKVNMQAIETIVMQCPKINSCSCIWLPRPMLLVVYFSSEKIDSQHLSGFLKTKLEQIDLPDKVIKVKSLPINEHGKLSKQLLIKLYESTLDEGSHKDNFRTAFLKELKMSLDIHQPYNEVKDKDLFSLGGTSILAVTLCNKLSLEYPETAKTILPYLLSHKTTIGKTLQMAHRVELGQNVSKLKLKAKRSRSSIESCTESSSCKKSSLKAKVNISLSEEWFYDTGKCVDATPTVFESKGVVYVTVGSHSGKIVSFEALTGELRGVLTMNSRVEASVFCYQDITGEGCGVVGTYDGTVVCYMLKNCATVWQTNIGSMIKSKATCLKDVVYIAAYDGNIWCIKLKNGQILSTIAVSSQAISADLVSGGGWVVCGALSGECACVRGTAVRWRATLQGPVFAGPAIVQGGLVVLAEVGGVIHCRTLDNGLEVWKYDGAKGNIFSSLHIKQKDNTNWQIIFGCHDSKVYCVNIVNNQCDLAWTLDVGAPVYATPCMLNNYVVAISTKGRLVLISSNKGTIMYEYRFPSEIFSSPVVFVDHIFVGCRNDKLYAMKYKVN